MRQNRRKAKKTQGRERRHGGKGLARWMKEREPKSKGAGGGAGKKNGARTAFV